MNLSRLIKLTFLHLQHLPIKSKGWRSAVCKWGGVKIIDAGNTFVGEDVVFDTNYPEDIIVEPYVCITTGCKFITHFMGPADGRYVRGQILIGEGTYIGMGTIVCKPVTIGKGCIIGAGSVVTKDIPDGEIWAGNPARFIKKNPNPDWRLPK